MPEEPRSRYAGSLADLEAAAHVPLEQQVTELAEAPAEAPISAEELDRQRLLGITGAGRLNVRWRVWPRNHGAALATLREPLPCRGDRT